VFHYRPDEWTGEAHDAVPDHLRARFVPFEAGGSEWLWEREWRVVTPRFEFTKKDVVAVIIGERFWPGVDVVEYEDPIHGPATHVSIPEWMPLSERWWWSDEEKLEIVEDRDWYP
jgi:hypothetical protein